MISRAQDLRRRYPERFGVKGSKPGDMNYVKHGWRKALKASANRRYKPTRTIPATPPEIERKNVAVTLTYEDSSVSHVSDSDGVVSS